VNGVPRGDRRWGDRYGASQCGSIQGRSEAKAMNRSASSALSKMEEYRSSYSHLASQGKYHSCRTLPTENLRKRPELPISKRLGTVEPATGGLDVVHQDLKETENCFLVRPGLNQQNQGGTRRRRRSLRPHLTSLDSFHR